MNKQTSNRQPPAQGSRQPSDQGGHQPPGQGWNHPHGQGPEWYPPVQRTSGQAVAVLVLGIASLTVFWAVAGIAALVLARGARRDIAASGGRLGGNGLVRAGVICSWISIALTVLAAILVAVLLLAFATSGAGVDTTVVETVPLATF